MIDFGVTAADKTSFVNMTSGVFNLTDDFAGLVPYTSYDTATFSNAGILEKTGGSATSTIDAVVTNTGSIVVASGTLGIYGGGSFGGNISGAGALAFTAGSSTLSTASTTATVLVDGGTLDATTAESMPTLDIASGTLSITANTTVTGTFNGTAGSVFMGSGTTLKLSGAATFDNVNADGPVMYGPGTFTTTGATTATTQSTTYVDLYLSAGVSWVNSGTVSVGGEIDFGVTAADTAAFVNQIGGVFNLGDDLASLLAYTSYDRSTFSNAGTLEKTGGTGTSTIDAVMANTGSIVVSTGTIGFFGGGRFGGNISGTGTIAFAANTSTLSATTSANVLVDGGMIAIAANETVSGGFTEASGVVTLASGATLKLTSSASFDNVNTYGPEVIGPGTLSTAGTATLTTQSADYVDLYIAGGATWVNSSTATIGGQIDFGVTAADNAAFVNQTGAVVDMVDDFAGFVPYTSYDTATFSNAGILEKTGGSATSAIYAVMTNTGSIVIASGTIGFFGGGSFGGNISGTGTIAFTAGTSTLSATTSANVLVNGGTLGITGNETVSGAFSETSGTLTLPSGATLKLTGAASFGAVSTSNSVVIGPGTLSTAGATTFATQSAAYVDLYFSGGATWSNSGNASVGGQIDYGIVPADSAAFVNRASGVVNLIDDVANLVPYTSYDTATFSNAGLLEKTGGIATSVISPTLTNTGIILVSAGTLSLPVLTNLSSSVLTGGTFEATAGAVLQLANDVTIVTDAATIILSGAGSAMQSLNTTTSTQVALDSTLSTIATTGALRVLGGRNFTAVANGGSLTDNGQLQLGGGTLTTTSLTVGIGADLLGFGTVKGPVASSGLADANGGLLLLSSALTGASSLEADAGATLQLAANAAITADSKVIDELPIPSTDRATGAAR